MNWERKMVMVTGAGGFIGSHLVERLVKLGAKVRVLVRYNSRNNRGALELLAPNVKGDVDVVLGDLRDSETVREAVKNVDIIFHLAALIAIPYSYIHPREVVETNVIGTLNVMNACKSCEVSRIIHTSTSEVYGSAQYVPIDEKHPLRGQSPYSASKIGADMLAESYYRSYDLPVAILRPFNTYGPRQSGRAVIPTIVTQALTQNNVFLGSLYPTRDFSYVKDVIDGFIKMAEIDKAIGEVINIGSGVEISIRDLVYKIFSLVGGENEVISEPKRIRPVKSEVERLCADNSKANSLIGWQPKVSIEDGLNWTIGWIKENIKHYKAGVYNI